MHNTKTVGPASALNGMFHRRGIHATATNELDRHTAQDFNVFRCKTVSVAVRRDHADAARAELRRLGYTLWGERTIDDPDVPDAGLVLFHARKRTEPTAGR